MFWDRPNYQELLLYYYKTFSYPLIQKNDECISDIYTNLYWGLIEDITASEYILIGIALGLVIF